MLRRMSLQKDNIRPESGKEGLRPAFRIVAEREKEYICKDVVHPKKQP